MRVCACARVRVCVRARVPVIETESKFIPVRPTPRLQSSLFNGLSVCLPLNVFHIGVPEEAR